MITTYDQFVGELNKTGFMMFWGNNGLPKLDEITRPEAWHNGPPHDPWNWKDELAQRKQGVYGRIIGGGNSFVSLAWFGAFIDAFTPGMDYETRYRMGTINPMVRDMAALFEERPTWARHDLADALGVDKRTRSKFEGALARLQGELYIVVSGQSQRLSSMGMPMGWPSMEYTLTDAWIEDTPITCGEQNAAQARQSIIAHAAQLCPHIAQAHWERLFAPPKA